MSTWAQLKEALAGVERDYTREPVTRAIFYLAVPMVLEMAMESLFSIVDIFWVSRLGSDAVAGVGLTESVLTLVYCVASGIALATTATVARRIGEGDADGAARSAVQAIFLGLFISVLMCLPGVLFAPELLRAMGAEPAVVAAGLPFTRLIMASAPSIMLLFLMNAVFRGAGDAAIAMRVLWAANLVNLVLDPCLIYGLGPFPRLGVAGAAVSTTIGRTFGVALQLWALYRARGRMKVERHHLCLDFAIMWKLARISITGMAQSLIAHASWIGLVRVIAASGSAAVAGYTIAIRIVIFTLLPSWGLSNAAATLVGQNLGARQPERAEQSVWRCGLCNMVFLGAIGLVFVTLPALLVGLFSNDHEVVRIGADCLRVLSYGYIFYAYGMVMAQAFNGAGDTLTPTLLNLGSYWVFQIPVAWLLAIHWGLGAHGAFWAVPLAESVLAVMAVVTFRRGAWKSKVI